MTRHAATLAASQRRVDVTRGPYEDALGERRAAVHAARADGETIVDIARALGIRENSVRQLLGIATTRKGRGLLSS